ncbi:MAG: VOC family protein, partial [Candidatus Acidiferrum sp.]
MQTFGTMRVNRIAVLLALCLLGVPLAARMNSKSRRPKIKGLAFVRLNVSDIARSRKFYEETFQLGNHVNHCLGAQSVCFRLNPSTTIELVQADVPPGGSMLEEIGYWTDDLDSMRRYLTASNIRV